MFHVLGRDPIKKSSGTLTIDGFDGIIRYVASAKMEVYRFMTKEPLTEVGAIIVKEMLDKDTKMKLVKAEISDKVYDFKGIIFENSYSSFNPVFVADAKPMGELKKPKNFEYISVPVPTDSNDVNNLGDIKLEDIIYKTVSKNDLLGDKDLSWLAEKDYRILYTREETLEWLKGLEAYDDSEYPVGFDTETTGLNANRNKIERLVGICMSYEFDAGVYIPIEQKRSRNNEIPLPELLELLRPFLDRKSKKKKRLITHNGQFDYRVMKMFDIELNITDDTYVMLALLNMGDISAKNSLKGAMHHYFKIDVLELTEPFVGLNATTLTNARKLYEMGAPLDELTAYKLDKAEKGSQLLDFRFIPDWFIDIYGPADGDFPRLLYRYLKENDWADLDGKLDFTYNLEIMVIPALVEQEYFGVHVIPEGFEELRDKTSLSLMELTPKIYEMAGHEFDINSGKQLSRVLYDEMGAPKLDKYKTKDPGIFSTDKHTLKDMAALKNEDGTPKIPIVGIILEYKKKSTLISSFYGKLPKLIENDYLFPRYNPLRAETGRMTCQNPNIQQSEPSTRKFMIPDSDEYYFLVCDYSQVERRIMGGLSHDESIVVPFNNDPEMDSHIQTYSNMFGVPYENVDGKMRKLGKSLNFGTAYSLGPKSLASTIWGNDDDDHKMMAQELLDTYWLSAPKLQGYLEKERDLAEETFYAKTYFGRRRRINRLVMAHDERDPRKKSGLVSKGRREAGNMPVQGTAADILKMALVRLQDGFRKRGIDDDRARQVMNIHDEVVYQIHNSIHPWMACAIMREAMEIDLSDIGFPPLYIGANVGYSWHDGKAEDLEAPVMLMDRQCQWAWEQVENGVPIDRFPNCPTKPREFWGEQITDYAAEQSFLEYRKGYKVDGVYVPIQDLHDAHRNGRLVKYANHFNPLRDLFIMEASVVDNYLELYTNKEEILRCKSANFLKAVNYINETPIILDDLTKEDVFNLSFFSASWKELLQLKAKHGLITNVEFIEWYNVSFADGTTILLTVDKSDHPNYPRTKTQGELIEETSTTVADLVRQTLRLTKDRKNYVIMMENLDERFIVLLNYMVITYDLRNALNTNMDEARGVYLKLPSGKREFLTNRFLIKEMRPLLVSLVAIYVGAKDYTGFEDAIDKVGLALSK